MDYLDCYFLIFKCVARRRRLHWKVLQRQIGIHKHNRLTFLIIMDVIVYYFSARLKVLQPRYDRNTLQTFRTHSTGLQRNRRGSFDTKWELIFVTIFRITSIYDSQTVRNPEFKFWMKLNHNRLCVCWRWRSDRKRFTISRRDKISAWEMTLMVFILILLHI